MLFTDILLADPQEINTPVPNFSYV